MTSEMPRDPSINCAENISLLYLLHPVPALPSSNPIRAHTSHPQGYTLSFERERCLAGILAFLSSTKDDPARISAVSLQECRGPAVLNVLLAVNRVDSNDGHQVLERIRQRFEAIFNHLSRVTNNGNPSIQGDVFSAIVSMCSERILCRLRLASNSKDKPKQAFKNVIQEAIAGLQTNPPTDPGLLSAVGIFIERARTVNGLVDAWSNHQVLTRLEQLVEGVHHLWQLESLPALINGLPNTAMSPSSKSNLLNIVSKVARYRSAARFLYRSAKSIPLVRRMKTVVVGLPRKAFNRIPFDQNTFVLSSALSRIERQHKSRLSANLVARYLRHELTKLNQLFASQTRKSLQESKIHAEVQLLCHFELQPCKFPPRVIGSSKDACFLCNELILMNGKTHTPRSHGRLYPVWRLPSLPRLNPLQHMFNQVLERRIRDSLATLEVRKTKTFYPDPNESTLITILSSASTLGVHAPPVLTNSEAQQQTEGHTAPENIADPTCSPSLGISPTTPMEHESSRMEIAQETASEHVPQCLLREDPISPIPSWTDSNRFSLSSTYSEDGTTDYALRQGQILSRSIGSNHGSSFYTIGPLEIQIEYSTYSNNRSRKLDYTIEWLTVEALERLQQHRAISIVDGESLTEGVFHAVDNNDHLYISAHGSVMKIVFD